MIIPVILAGGRGQRLWPLSQAQCPKPFLALNGRLSLLQQTVLRASKVTDERPLIIVNEAHRFLVAEHLRQLGVVADIVLEPCVRDTAPAIAMAALQALSRVADDVDPLLLILPSDHALDDVSAWLEAVQSLLPTVQEGAMGLLTITPSSAECGYGYVRLGKIMANSAVREVDGFVEKPSAESAQRYVADGQHGWNSGIFFVSARTVLSALARYHPAIDSACRRAWQGATTDLDFIRVDAEAFAQNPTLSFDYAVMEPLAQAGARLFAASISGWNDLGSWAAIWQQREGDKQGNVVHAAESVFDESSSNNFIHADGKRVLAVGVRDVVLVVTEQAVLLANRADSTALKAHLDNFDGEDSAQYQGPVYRPWGYYQVVDADQGFQVKRLVLYPAAQLSLQWHRHRAEHWVVVSGEAEVIKGDQCLLLCANQSTYIAPEEPHSLRNIGDGELHMIEVQSGEYLGEDDIVRVFDPYRR